MTTNTRRAAHEAFVVDWTERMERLRHRAPTTEEQARAAELTDALFTRMMQATESWADAHAISRKGLRAAGLTVPDLDSTAAVKF